MPRSERQHERVRLASRARAEATRILVRRHQEEYDEIYAACAKVVGVTPLGSRRAARMKKLRDELARLEQLSKLEEL